MMKAKIILVFMISFISLYLFAQESKHSKRKKMYYFSSNSINKNISSKDTLAFIKGVDKKMPSINLKSTSQFVIAYHVVLDTIVKRMADGTYVQKIVEHADEINGFWRSKDLTTQVELIFSDDVINDYNIKEEEERIYFIKK